MRFINLEKDVLENLIIDEEDKKCASFYIKVKGVFLYKHVLDVFSDRFGEIKFNYKEISAFIKYDKSLRNCLYTYLGYLEEALRAEILSNFDLKEIPKKRIKTFYCNDFEARNDGKDSKLYNYLIKYGLGFGKLTAIVKFLFKDKYDPKKLKKLVKFRNMIMHHNLLLFNDYKKWTEVKKNIKSLIDNELKFIYDFLPKGYQSVFVDKINLCTREKENLTRITLREIAYE